MGRPRETVYIIAPAVVGVVSLGILLIAVLVAVVVLNHRRQKGRVAVVSVKANTGITNISLERNVAYMTTLQALHTTQNDTYEAKQLENFSSCNGATTDPDYVSIKSVQDANNNSYDTVECYSS